MKTEKDMTGGFDYFRIVAALLVIAIHTSPLTSYSDAADYILVRILARVAVPFFIMVTGYFLDTESGSGKILRKLTLYYMVSILLYLPVNIYSGHFKGLTVLGVIKSLIFDGTFYHLWYFPGIILGIAMVSLLIRKLPYYAVLLITMLLYVVGLFGDCYYGLLPANSIYINVYDMIYQICGNTRNGIFFVPVFLVLGIGIRSMPEEKKRYVVLQALSLLVLLLGMTGEGIWLWQDYYVDTVPRCMYVLLIPCMIVLISLLSRLRLRPAPMLRGITTVVYIIHPLCIIVVRGAAKVLHMEHILVDQSFIHYIAVSIVSFGGACIMETLWKNIVWKKILKPNFWTEKNQNKMSRAWIEVDRKKLRHNIETFRSLLPPECELMPAVKANAYGHGAVEIAEELSKMGIRAFCVASVDEAIELRLSGIQGDILILGITPSEQIHLIHQYHLIQTVVDAAYADELNAYGKRLAVHIKIDTGMHRLGEWCEHIEPICHIFKCENLDVQGIYTHLCCAESESEHDKEYTYRQYRRFMETIQALEIRGYQVGKKHILASSGILHVSQFGGDYARLGIAMYGVCSEREEEGKCGVTLDPVMSVRTRVEVVKNLKAGESAGYDLQYTAKSNRRLAVLSIGYADGIPRSLSCGNGKVLIRGQEAPIVGRICMDQMLVDVTGIENVCCGDIATILGQDSGKEITAYDLAESEGTITNEILSRMGSRLVRVVV